MIKNLEVNKYRTNRCVRIMDAIASPAVYREGVKR